MLKYVCSHCIISQQNTNKFNLCNFALFFTDLEDLLNSLSQKLDRYMSSQEAFEALSERYHLELMSAHGSCVLLQSELHSIINSEDGSKIMFEGIDLF